MDTHNRIVFIGDSITEWGRDGSPRDVGTGYVKLIHDYLITTYPDKKFEMYNKGVGGNRITDLLQRWQKDVIDLQPDVVSISIGINDVWRQMDNPNLEQITPVKFESIYRDLINQVKEQTKASIIVMEPTVIGEELQSEGNVILKDYVSIVQKIGNQTKVKVVPTHDAFISYLKTNNGHPLTTDGVHMTPLGNMLIAKTWLNEVVDSL